MSTWPEAPGREAVEAAIRAFFEALHEGRPEVARALVDHAHDDWDAQLWSLWQDTHLVALEEMDTEVDDDTFDGRGWERDRAWMRGLGLEDVFHWRDESSLYVNVAYQGVVTDVSAEFSVVEVDGRFRLRRDIIHVA